MADETEVEIKDLQETVEELHREREAHEEEERRSHWTRYVALTTAVLAAFGAVAALESASLANEGMMNQLRASDTWNEYQASKMKTHVYGIAAAALLDNGIKPSGAGSGVPKSERTGKNVGSVPSMLKETEPQRLAEYLAERKHEESKTGTLSSDATKRQEEAERQIHRHHQFAYSVALLQVAIALGAVAALSRMKSVWVTSLGLGAAGIVLFALGLLTH
jgi:hypothetical protein